MLQEDWQGLMSPCLKNLMSSDCLLIRVSDLKICLSRGIFPQALITLIVCGGRGGGGGGQGNYTFCHPGTKVSQNPRFNCF